MLIQIFIVRFLWREFSWQYFVILWQYFAQCISMYLLTILSIFSCSCYRSRNWCDRQISSGQAIWRSIEVMDPSERAHNSSPQNSTWPVQFSMVPGWWFGTFGLFFHILLGIMINIWINMIGIIFPYYYLNNDPNNIFYFSIYWECHHPNWRTPYFFRGVGQPPTRCQCGQRCGARALCRGHWPHWILIRWLKWWAFFMDSHRSM